MIFGKHINRYYLRHAPALLLGVVTLIVIDYIQLIVPNLYGMVVNGINEGFVEIDGAPVPFNMDFLLDKICLPLVFIILAMVLGRFLWRICFFGAAVKVEIDLRSRMFDHCKGLSQQYYQVNKVGNLMSLFTNDLETIHESFAWGILMLCDALFLGGISAVKMVGMHPLLTLLCLIPMIFLFIIGMILDKYLTLKWDERQESFSRLSDFSQESFAGIAVIKAFVKEAKELSAFRRLNRENEKVNVAYVRLSVALNISVMNDGGIFCYGPFAADGFMGSGNYCRFDAILAMYHDQGLAPLKALGMNDGINFTAGLSIVRTSPAHGVAYDIAGKGLADENSFRQAIYAAIDICRNRKMYNDARRRPLQKLYFEKRDDSNRLNLQQSDND